MVTEADWNNWETSDLKPYLAVVFENFSTDNIMYGSDWPVCNLAANYESVAEVLENYMSYFATADQNKIWFENAKIFYKL
jgi:L-fuconolactonase